MGLSPVPADAAPGFIGPDGAERYVAAPVADHTSSGAAYLPAGPIAGWGRCIALLARTLTS